MLALPFLLWGRWLGSAGTPNHDVDALIELYQQTGGTEWVKNENWCDLQKPIGDWYGVKVRFWMVANTTSADSGPWPS